MSSRRVIEVENLSKRYSGQRAVNNISFQVNQGEIVGLLGPNGAGKTTTMRILATLQPATAGAVRVVGCDVFHAPLAARQAIGYLPENNPLPPEMRVREYLRFRAALKRLPKPRRRIEKVMEVCGLEKVQTRIIGQLSRGYRQRVGLADALVHAPALVILDEPTAGLDPNQIRAVRELIKLLAPKITVILSTHILSEVALTCNRVIMLHKGRILADESTESLYECFAASSEVRAEMSGPVQEIQQALQHLPEIAEVTAQELDPPFSRFILRGRTQQDIRPKVFDLACRKRWPLRELRRREYPLEKIFSRLTKQSAVK